MSLTDNLVGYWKADESSGNMTDYSGNSYTATNNAVTFQAGKINNGALFNSTSDRFTVGDQTNLKFSKEHSLNVWVNLQGTTPTGWSPAFFKGDDGVDFWCIALYWDSTNKLKYIINAVRGNNAQIQVLSSSITVDSNWHMITAIYNGTTMKIYWDTTEVGTGNTTSSIDTTDAWYLGNTNTARAATTMMYDEWGMWSRGITTTEMNTLYNSGNGLQYPFSLIPVSPFPSFRQI